MNWRKVQDVCERVTIAQFKWFRRTLSSVRHTFITWVGSLLYANMGTTQSLLTTDQLDEYAQLTFLNRNEICYILKKFSSLDITEIQRNLNHRFSMEHISNLFTELKYNPFGDRIFRVFSNADDCSLNFEEFLNLCSVFSENCPLKVKAAWAFLIYDFDEDNQITKTDIGEMLNRLTKPQVLNDEEKDQIAETLLNDMDLQHLGGINQLEFLHAMSKLPDFAQIFSFKP